MNQITRRFGIRFSTISTFVAAIVMGLISSNANAVAQTKRPNVVLVMTDDQGWGDLSSHGNPVLETPHLDRLAAESARLAEFYVHPVCTPTRSALDIAVAFDSVGGEHNALTAKEHTCYYAKVRDVDVPMAIWFAALVVAPAPSAVEPVKSAVAPVPSAVAP